MFNLTGQKNCCSNFNTNKFRQRLGMDYVICWMGRCVCVCVCVCVGGGGGVGAFFEQFCWTVSPRFLTVFRVISTLNNAPSFFLFLLR